MNVKAALVAVALAATAPFPLVSVSVARADDAPCATLARSNLVACALSASLGARSEELALESLEGRRRAASVLLPSNPVVALGGGYTVDPTLAARDREPLWSASLSQEVEVAGQRGKRLEVVAAERTAQEARLALARRDVASTAWLAWFDALAAVEESKVAAQLGELARALRTVARGRAQVGVGADVDAQLAEAASTRLAVAQLAAEQRVAVTSATLALLVGKDPAGPKPRAEGVLEPLTVVGMGVDALVASAVARRADIAVAAAERDAQQRRVALYERLRIPNPTLSVFVRNDWIGERSAGVGLAFPLPMPAPVGRTYAGEIAEADALAQRAGTEAERLRRAVRLEVFTAAERVATRQRQLALYRPEQVRETEATLRAIGEAIEARRLPVREALLTQQGLVELLVGNVEARKSLCFASVELARAAGLALEQGAR